MFDASNLSSNAGDQQNVPKMKPTTPLMRSKTLAMRSRPRPKTDWKAEKTPLRMPERISTREEKRFERPLVREDIVGCFIVSLILRGWFWGGGEMWIRKGVYVNEGRVLVGNKYNGFCL